MRISNTALLVLISAMTSSVQANNGDAAAWPFNTRGIEYPTLRYTPWSLLEGGQQDSAELLGCT